MYWVLPPFAPKLQEKREQTENTARFTAFLRRWMAEFPRLVVLDAEHSGFAPNLFYDGSHLDREGSYGTQCISRRPAQIRDKRPWRGTMGQAAPISRGTARSRRRGHVHDARSSPQDREDPAMRNMTKLIGQVAGLPPPPPPPPRGGLLGMIGLIVLIEG